MNITKIYRIGLYLSVAVLLASVGVVLWPMMATTRFWLAAGFCGGIVGTFLFSVALSSADIKTEPDYEQE